MLDLEKLIEPYTYRYTSKFNGIILETKMERALEPMYYTFRMIKDITHNVDQANNFVKNNEGRIFIFNTKVLTEDLRTILYTAINTVGSLNYNIAAVNVMQLRFGQTVDISEDCKVLFIDSLFFNNSNFILEEVRRVIDTALRIGCIIFLYTISDYAEDVLYLNLKLSFNRDKTTFINFNNFL